MLWVNTGKRAEWIMMTSSGIYPVYRELSHSVFAINGTQTTCGLVTSVWSTSTVVNKKKINGNVVHLGISITNGNGRKTVFQICGTSLALISLIFEFPTTDSMLALPLYLQPLVFLKSRITVGQQERILLSNRPSFLFGKSTPLMRNT
ncbi:unnamed protein product [Larinioides sclopetarius]|uniref:Uncharacterized protein n=1 Tax=Larinioides sclopetarius TaxID=280406 RepID=A0AAV2BGV6_9ARAC